MEYGPAEISAIVGLAISAIVFYLLAAVIGRSELGLDSFLFADRKLTPSQFQNTFVASSISLATVFLFFLSNASTYGLWLLACGVTYFIGQYILVYCASKFPINFDDNHTISDLLHHTIGSKVLARIATAITATSLIAMVFIELFFGAVVLAIFIPEDLYARTLSFFGLGVLVLLYLRIGGYKAIVETDFWQLLLLLTAMAAMLLGGLMLPAVPSDGSEIKIWSAEASPSAIAAFIIWITFINLCMPFSEVPFWQRVVAVNPSSEALSATLKSSWKFAIVWFIPVFVLVFLWSKGYEFDSLRSFFETMRSGPGHIGSILYPLLVIGLASALFSTIDSRLMGIILIASDSVTFRKALEKKNKRQIRNVMSIFVLILVASLSIMYFIAYFKVFDWFIPLIYAMFGPLAAITPLAGYAIWSIAKKGRGRPINLWGGPVWVLCIALILGWVVNLVSVALNEMYDTQVWAQLAAPLGAGVVALGIFVFHINLPKYSDSVKHPVEE